MYVILFKTILISYIFLYFLSSYLWTFWGVCFQPQFCFFDNRLQKMKVNNNVGFTLDHKRPVDYI